METCVPELFVCLDVACREEAHSREAQVLVFDEHLDGEKVRLTQVIDEPTHVAVATRVYTVRIRLLERKHKSTMFNGRLIHACVFSQVDYD